MNNFMNLVMLNLLETIKNIYKPLISICFFKEIISGYKLIKTFKHTTVPKIADNKIINLISNKSNKKNIIIKEFENEVNRFVKIMSENFSNEELVLMNNNLTNILIERRNLKGINNLFGFIRGYYHIEDNKILIGKESKTKTIFHELLHLSSSHKSKGVLYSGFFQYSQGNEIGRGLNEGYTELLREKLFFDSNEKTYEYEKKVAKVLEKILGEDKMKSLYIKANLSGIISELEKYEKKENIYQFLLNLDFICKNSLKYKTILTQNLLFKICKENISMFLISIFSKKLNIEYNNNKITKKEFIERLEKIKIIFLEENMKISKEKSK